MANPKFAILVDGGFLVKKLGARFGRFPTIEEVEEECRTIPNHVALSGFDLLRIYFYDARPATKQITNPIDGTTLNLANTQVHHKNTSLQQALELRPDFALRIGETAVHGWELGKRALKDISSNTRQVEARDLVPNVEQKGVDLRIGLDIARLSLQSMVDVIVLVSGDSDFIPAMKFARREGVRVYLYHMGHGVKRDLKVHTDLVL